MRRWIFPSATVAVVLAALTLVAIGNGTSTEAAGRPQVVSAFGQVPGTDLIVHVTVIVPEGQSAAAAAAAALRAQGARPFASADFTTTGLVWDQFFDERSENDFVTQYYNSQDDPTGGGRNAFENTQGTWTGVGASSFVFADGGDTTRCPSLVRECKGPQTFDGNNDVAWVALRSSTTLAVAWYGTSTDEVDIAMNTKFTWAINGGDFDVETVLLHEQGHAVGLGHSTVAGAIMAAYYGGVQRTLGGDDISGISTLYPVSGSTTVATGSISGTVTDGSISIDGATVSIDDTGLSMTTGTDGSYLIEDVPVGTYSVTASATGFESGTANDVDVTDDGNTVVDFALSAVTPGTMVGVDWISYSTEGGKNGDKHLMITVHAADDLGQDVAGATISITLSVDGTLVGSGTANTGTDGTVSWTVKNATSGCYTTEVVEVSDGSLSWDDVQTTYAATKSGVSC